MSSYHCIRDAFDFRVLYVEYLGLSCKYCAEPTSSRVPSSEFRMRRGTVRGMMPFARQVKHNSNN